MSLVLYGIPNCDTVKKARVWLTANGHEFVFHDYKKQVLPESELQAWLQQQDWQILLNRKGTTWRALSEERKLSITDAGGALELMRENPSIIKRPVLVADGKILAVGFDATRYASLLAS